MRKAKDNRTAKQGVLLNVEMQEIHYADHSYQTGREKTQIQILKKKKRRQNTEIQKETI